MSTDTMSTTDNQVLTEILETLKGLSPPPILTDINKSIETLQGKLTGVIGTLNTDLTGVIGTLKTDLTGVIGTLNTDLTSAISASTNTLIDKLERDWVDYGGLALSIAGLGVGIAGLKGVTAVGAGTAVAAGARLLKAGATLITIPFILKGLTILASIALLLGLIKASSNSRKEKGVVLGLPQIMLNKEYSTSPTKKSKPLYDTVSGVAPKVTPTSLPYSRYLNSGMSNTSVEKVKKSTETTRKTVLGIIPKTSQIVLPDTKQVALPITKQIATNANQASGLAVNIPNNQPLVSNDKNISPVTFNTIMSACNSSNGAKGSSSTSNTNSTHHHQNVYNIANIDIADGMISDLEDLIQAINRHAC